MTAMRWDRTRRDWVAYLNDEFEPVPEEEATLVKHVRADGTVWFYRPLPPEGAEAGPE